LNKRELADRVCEILGLELESLTKMSKSDLEKLAKFLDDPQNLIRLGVKRLREKARGQIAESVKQVLERPIIELISEEREDRGGIFGLGIIPSILKRSEKA